MKTDTQTVKLIEKQIGIQVTRGGGWRKEELGGVAKGTNNTRDVLYNMISIINTAAYYIWKVLREEIMSFYHKNFFLLLFFHIYVK